MVALDPNAFDSVTFDCYGTLIDWETGLLGGLVPVVRSRGLAVDDDRLLELFAEHETVGQNERLRSYREVLVVTFERIAEVLGIVLLPGEETALVDSFRFWPAFPDSVAALHSLAQRFSLNILSNTDDDLFALSRGQLPGVRFDHVVTAQQVGVYKPSPAMFEAALERIGTPRDRHLHVAQSLFHDIRPASDLGWRTVGVDRRQAFRGSGATPPVEATPSLVVPDLATLAAWAS